MTEQWPAPGQQSSSFADRLGWWVVLVNVLCGAVNIFMLIVNIMNGAPIASWLLNIILFCFIGLNLWSKKLIDRQRYQIDRLAKVNEILAMAERTGLRIVRMDFARPGSDATVIREDFDS